ncbi:hypothetical protein G6F70_008099 [Rhizopus microsporus]|nr:hypothetical protein G6F71_008096 [Rhizopus microsporus]KAG1195614.1 hypothetical protein G6F70_008099 [Rhizopus microsporus]KAG1207449.1 hypothetical protein G6F69_008041 [Rhizopus microsporus]KAG1228236.1 hypothetical protein G6F67_007959 [Rhizopus microsporus]KAG1260201.1 hypothetical protein G6F68_007598 [Rhizopus microsporus]
MGNVQYQPPNAIPDAAHRMKPPQTKQDMALKRLQYLISGIFCPLNIFGHEISLDNENANIQRYLTILADCHTLLLNLSSQVNNMLDSCSNQKFYDASCRFSSSPSDSPDTLFLHSYAPLKPLSVHTIQRWIGKHVRISTTEPCVSLRSIASSLALKAGIPKDDTVTMGNWFPSAVFENHYRREHLSQFDFSNTLIDIDDAIDEDDGQFFDAEDNMACD